MEDISALEKLPVSVGLKEKLLEHGVVKHFFKGQILLQEDAYIRSIPLILSGTLKVFKSDDEGKEVLLYYIQSGESCVMSILGGLYNERSKLRAEVEEDAEILFLPLNDFLQLMKEYPQWLEFVFKLYHKRFEELLQVVEEIAFKRVDERLWSLLGKKSQLMGTKELQVSHEQLAQELGTARVVVSRLLKQLENEGKVVLGRNKIKIKH